MNLDLNLAATELARRRVTVILLVSLGFILVFSLVVFALTPQWSRRVFFFPEVNSSKYASEVRALPPGARPIEDIRALLDDLLLGPSNMNYAPALPAGTRLVSAMLDGNELYVGLSREIYRTGNGSAVPREMLQGVADTVYFNFPWVSNIRFFIGGKELSDGPVFSRTARQFELARALVPAVADPAELLRIAGRHPLFGDVSSSRNVYQFRDGARWDERILR